jgi:hypothetical protein
MVASMTMPYDRRGYEISPERGSLTLGNKSPMSDDIPPNIGARRNPGTHIPIRWETSHP